MQEVHNKGYERGYLEAFCIFLLIFFCKPNTAKRKSLLKKKFPSTIVFSGISGSSRMDMCATLPSCTGSSRNTFSF